MGSIAWRRRSNFCRGVESRRIVSDLHITHPPCSFETTRYPPTSGHLMVLLSMFHEALVGEDDILHSKITLAEAPSLIVLCDLSSYFLDDASAM